MLTEQSVPFFLMVMNLAKNIKSRYPDTENKIDELSKTYWILVSLSRISRALKTEETNWLSKTKNLNEL